MALRHLNDAKALREYCKILGRAGVGRMVEEIAQEIVKGDGAYQSTMILAGKIRALATGCKFDSYWDEKQEIGWQDMVAKARWEVGKDKSGTV